MSEPIVKPSAMKLRLVPATQGMRWIREGALAVVRFPLAFASIFATGLFGVMVLGFVPYHIGELLFLVLLPTGTLFFMVASRLAAERQGPLPMAFVEVLQAPRPVRVELMKLGVAAMLSVVASMLLSHLLDHGVLWRFVAQLGEMQSRPDFTPPAAIDPQVQWALLLQMALVMVVAIPFWHAPGLIHWGGYRWAQSMFFSAIAIWRNKGAFAVYGFTWVALMTASSLVLTVAAALLGPVIATFPLVLTALFGWTLFFATRYFTFIDCFERSAVDDVATTPR